jgi:hypothetical protein
MPPSTRRAHQSLCPSLYEKFEGHAREAFRFLEDDYGFKLVHTNRNRYSSVILYQNATTGVEIEFEPRENRIWVMLYRLVNGKLPEYQSVQELDRDATNRFDLDSLIELKAPSLLAEREARRLTVREHDVEPAVAQRAAELHLFGGGILRGDFALFADLGRLKQERIRKARGK